MPKRRLTPEAEWDGTKAHRTISCVEEGLWLQGCGVDEEGWLGALKA